MDSDTFYNTTHMIDPRQGIIDWVFLLPFCTIPEDEPLLPPEADDEAFLKNRAKERTFEMWKEDADYWFIERDRAILERDTKWWDRSEYTPERLKNGFDQRIMHLRRQLVLYPDKAKCVDLEEVVDYKIKRKENNMLI